MTVLYELRPGRGPVEWRVDGSVARSPDGRSAVVTDKIERGLAARGWASWPRSEGGVTLLTRACLETSLRHPGRRYGP